MPFVNPSKKSGAPVLTLEEAQAALQELLQGETRTKEYWRQRDTNEFIIGGHPFGLDVNVTSFASLNSDVYLIAFPGYTDESVEAMKVMIARHLPASDGTRLRVVKIRLESKRRGNSRDPLHDLFFELITNVGTFMCGGCNDYSGAGGSGGRQLLGIFKLIAAPYDIPLEEVVLSEADTRDDVQRLENAYNDYRRRHQVA